MILCSLYRHEIINKNHEIITKIVASKHYSSPHLSMIAEYNVGTKYSNFIRVKYFIW